MPLLRETQSNLMQFLYATGAVVLLVAALFLVMDWDYAQEVFALGILIEILVFIFSVIDPEGAKTHQHKEIAFPPKAKIRTSRKQVRLPKEQDMNAVIASLTEMNKSMEYLLQTTEQLSDHVLHVEEEQHDVLGNLDHYKSEINELRDQLEATRRKLDELR